MPSQENVRVRGILHAEEALRKFTLHRRYPPSELEPYVEHYWLVRWDLRGQEPHTQKVLSFPSVHLTFESDDGRRFSGVYGVLKKTFTRQLYNEGFTLGVKFRPGGFYPFLRSPLSRLTGKVLPTETVFGEAGAAVVRDVFAADGDEAMVRAAERFLLAHLPERDANVGRVRAIVEEAAADRSIVKVAQLSERFGISVRALQRLFDRYVGVHPKWVVRRFRLQEAAEIIEKGEQPDLLALALQLGYFDQSHFIRDFKAVVGETPLAHAKRTAAVRAASGAAASDGAASGASNPAAAADNGLQATTSPPSC